MLTSVMRLAGNVWNVLNISQQVDILLHGSRNLSFEVNAAIFSEVQAILVVLHVSHRMFMQLPSDPFLSVLVVVIVM
jgi:hypothetical protein